MGSDEVVEFLASKLGYTGETPLGPISESLAIALTHLRWLWGKQAFLALCSPRLPFSLLFSSLLFFWLLFPSLFFLFPLHLQSLVLNPQLIFNLFPNFQCLVGLWAVRV